MCFSNTGISEIKIPKSCSSFGIFSFSENSQLEKVEFEDDSSITEIPEFCFFNCYNLKSINLPKNIKKLEKMAFILCSKLTNISLEHIEVIGDNAFMSTRLQRIVIPSSIEKIGENAFGSCNSLREIIFESNSQLTEIGKDPFSNCKNIELLEMPGSFNRFRDFFINFSSSGSTYNSLLIKKVVLPPKEIIFEQIPDIPIESIVARSETNIENIGENAFNNMKRLIYVEFKCHVNNIATNAFCNCQNLEYIYMKEVQTISGSAFANNTKLKNITILEYNGIIPENCFQNCFSLAKIISNVNIISVGSYAFENCENIDLNTSDITKVGSYAFNNSRIKMFPSRITKIEEFAFYGCFIESRIVLTNKLEYIGTGSFYNLRNSIRYVHYCGYKNFPDNNNAFENLEGIVVPKNYNYDMFCNYKVIKSKTLSCYSIPVTEFLNYQQSVRFGSKDYSLRRLRP